MSSQYFLVKHQRNYGRLMIVLVSSLCFILMCCEKKPEHTLERYLTPLQIKKLRLSMFSSTLMYKDHYTCDSLSEYELGSFRLDSNNCKIDSYRYFGDSVAHVFLYARGNSLLGSDYFGVVVKAILAVRGLHVVATPNLKIMSGLQTQILNKDASFEE